MARTCIGTCVFVVVFVFVFVFVFVLMFVRAYMSKFHGCLSRDRPLLRCGLFTGLQPRQVNPSTYENDFERPFSVRCPPSQRINTVMSYHDNSRGKVAYKAHLGHSSFFATVEEPLTCYRFS